MIKIEDEDSLAERFRKKSFGQPSPINVINNSLNITIYNGAN